MNDDQFFLANSYIDGEATAEERAIAESDAELMSAVEELRALQTLVRDVDKPSVEARDRAIGAAMAQFSTASSTSTERKASRQAPVVPYRPWPGYARYLGVAAAVVAVGLLGLVVAQGLNNGSDDAASEPLAAPAPAAAADPSADAERVAPAAPDPEAAPDEAQAAIAPVPAPAPPTMAMDAAPEAADPGALSALSEELLTEFSKSRPVLTSPDELGQYGRFLSEQNEVGGIRVIPNTSCVFPDAEVDAPILGEAHYMFDDIDQQILIAVRLDETSAGEPAVFALDSTTCQIVAESTLL